MDRYWTEYDDKAKAWYVMTKEDDPEAKHFGEPITLESYLCRDDDNCAEAERTAKGRVDELNGKE